MSKYDNYNLKRNSILRLKSEIQSLFDNGEKEYFEIFKIIWTYDKRSSDGDVNIFISVPKKIINKAVHRNLIKRRLRESLRLNLCELREFCDNNNIYLKLGVVYLRRSIHDYNVIDQKIVLSLQKIYSKLYEIIQEN